MKFLNRRLILLFGIALIALLSAAAILAAPPSPYVNALGNGDFSLGFTNWTQSNTTWDVIPAGRLEFYWNGVSSGATIGQTTAYSASLGDPYNVIFDVANRASVSASLAVQLFSTTGSTNAVSCSFTIPANSPLTTYRMLAVAPGTWTNWRILFFTTITSPALQLDNVVVQYSPASQVGATVCTAPTPTPTFTPSPTPTPTFTPSPTPTPTAFPARSSWLLTPQINDQGTPEPAQQVEFLYGATIGDIAQVVFQAATFFVVMAVSLVWFLRGRRNS